MDNYCERNEQQVWVEGQKWKAIQGKVIIQTKLIINKITNYSLDGTITLITKLKKTTGLKKRRKYFLPNMQSLGIDGLKFLSFYQEELTIP